jgi:hypothetical protein
MKKAKFLNIYFYYFLIAFFLLLIASNFYYFFLDFNLTSLFPIIIQLIILLMLIYRDYRVKLVMRIWSGFFLILANGLIFFGRLLKEFSSGFQDFYFKNYLGCSFMLIIGVVIFLLNEKLVVISENNESVKL